MKLLVQHQIVSQNGVLNACGEQRHHERCVETVSNTTNPAAVEIGQRRGRPKASAERLLSLAAAPTFATMALLTWVNGGGSMSDMLCAATRDASPLGGMVAMYLLMSAFHLVPWLKLISWDEAVHAGHRRWVLYRRSRLYFSAVERMTVVAADVENRASGVVSR